MGKEITVYVQDGEVVDAVVEEVSGGWGNVWDFFRSIGSVVGGCVWEEKYHRTAGDGVAANIGTSKTASPHPFSPGGGGEADIDGVDVGGWWS